MKPQVSGGRQHISELSKNERKLVRRIKKEHPLSRALVPTKELSGSARIVNYGTSTLDPFFPVQVSRSIAPALRVVKQNPHNRDCLNSGPSWILDFRFWIPRASLQSKIQDLESKISVLAYRRVAS